MANADLILIEGSNMAECHPVGFQWVTEAKARGAKVIHIDPRFTRTSAVADTHVPIRVGEAVALDARVIKVGRTSMTVQVDVYREDMKSGEQQLATNGLFVFVAVDEHGKPTPVPPLTDGDGEVDPDPEARP
mgnify:CR=1 FL=1